MICDKKHCTGCGMCTAVCPTQCITLEKNEYGSLKYQVDEKKCIRCGKCERMCPQNSSVVQSVRKCYGGWAEELKERQTSASGGIAAALYRQMLSKGGAIVGACYENDEFRLKLTQDETEIEKFKGSKYVNCNSQHIYQEVKQKINQCIPVLFIGTPCQVAAIKSYIGASDLLYTVDLICHGTPPQSIFEEHFKINEKGIVSVNFRDGGLYKLSMKDMTGRQTVVDSAIDEYYLAFINGIIFSDCCYECQYASSKRCSDITIGDFRGIDEKIGQSEGVKRVSLVLSNTERGEKMLLSTPSIRLVERDLSEALPHNEQLSHPKKRTNDRFSFEKLYPKYGFSKTIHKLNIEKIRQKNKILTTLSKIKKKLMK